MGVVHFMGVGKSVGVVTCAVDYIEKCLELRKQPNCSDGVKRLLDGSGGIAHAEQNRGKIEAIVFFSSREVINQEMTAITYTGCGKPGSVRSEIEKRLKDVWKTYNPALHRKIIWCEVDVDDFRDCYAKAVKVAFRFARPGKQGKQIWCNLTGGTNAIGHALHSMSRLTAAGVKNYLIAQRKEIQAEWEVPSWVTINPDNDTYWTTVPYLKMLPDTGFYEVLSDLESYEGTTQSLFDRLRGRNLFTSLSIQQFRDSVMLRLFGLGYTTFDRSTDRVALSPFGKQFLEEELKGYLDGPEIETGTGNQNDNVQESRTWDWFTEVNLNVD
jgi:hypothetical protein